MTELEDEAKKAGEEAGKLAGESAATSFTNTLAALIGKEKMKPITDALKESKGDMSDAVVEAIKDAGLKGGKLLSSLLNQGLAGITEKSLELVAKLDFDEKGLEEQFKSFKKSFEDSPAGKVMTKLGMDPTGFSKVMDAVQDQIDPLANKEIIMKGFAFAGTELAVKKLKSASAGLVELEEKVLAVDRAALDANIGFITPTDVKQADGMAAGFGSARDAIDTYRQSVMETVAATQLSYEKVKEATQAFKAADLSFLEATDSVDGLTISMGEGERSAKGLEAALLLARGTGLDIGTVTKDLSMFTKTLGLTMKEATEKFGLYREVQEGTRLSLGEVHKGIGAVTKSLRFFGDTSDGVAASYKKFVGTLGTGKEALAAELFGQMAQQIGQLDPGLKAFLGTVGGMGSGRGAIAGALEVEEAIASGDISGVMDSIREEIEKTSGAGIMTRQEALASGQEEQFFLQRSLLKQFGIAGKSDEENTRILEMMAKGQEVQVKDIQKQRGLEEVAGVGRDVMRAETGVVQAGINVAEVTSQLGMTQDISEALFNTSGRFKEGSQGLVDAVKGFKETVDKLKGTGAAEKERTDSMGKTIEEVKKVEEERIAKGGGPIAGEQAAEFSKKMMKEGTDAAAVAAELDVADAGALAAEASIKGAGEVSRPGITSAAALEAPSVTLAAPEDLPLPPTEAGGATAAAAAPATTGEVEVGTGGGTGPMANTELVSALLENGVSQTAGQEATLAAVEKLMAQIAAGHKAGEDLPAPKFEIKLMLDGREFKTKVEEVTQKTNAKASQSILSPGAGR